MAGDFNARTKDYKDLIVEDDIDPIFGENIAYPVDEFSLPRKSKDSDFSNAYSVSLVKLCCTFYIHILNGRLFEDYSGNYTYFVNNGTSVADYVIASTSLFPKVINFGLVSFDLSDHLLLFCTLKLETKTLTL